MKRGMFIVFEGGEGAGKSVQAKLLSEKLLAEKIPVIATREPGGTQIGEQIRNITHDPKNTLLDPVAEAYLMAASRAQHVRELIEPSLEKGISVICDRFVDSSIAYQGFGRGLGEQVIAQLNELAVDGATPDIIFILNVPTDVGMMRRGKSDKTKDRLDLQQKEFYDRVQEGYLTLAKKFPNRYVVIDASASIEEVALVIWQTVQKKLPKEN